MRLNADTAFRQSCSILESLLGFLLFMQVYPDPVDYCSSRHGPRIGAYALSDILTQPLHITALAIRLTRSGQR